MASADSVEQMQHDSGSQIHIAFQGGNQCDGCEARAPGAFGEKLVSQCKES